MSLLFEYDDASPSVGAARNERKTMKNNQTMNQSYIKKRLVSLNETKKFHDCSFLFDNEEVIFSHKLILASSSPVFEAMLYGPLATTTTTTQSQIVINGDITANEFKQMLAFIYTDTVQIESVINAWSLVYIAKKYLIDDLLEYSLKYIKMQMDASNVLINYEYSEHFNEDTIRNICVNILQLYTKLIFRFDYHVKRETLCFVLEQNDLNCCEYELFEIVIKWAKTECEMQNLNATKENLRFLLFNSGIISRVRFLAIPQNQINDNSFTELLTNEEIEIFKSDEREQKLKLRNVNFSLNSSVRNNLPLFDKLAVRQVYKTSSTLFNPNYDSKLRTQIEANKLILVNGFCISPHRRTIDNFVANTYNERLKIRITNVVTHEVLVDFHVSKFVTCGDIQTIKMPQPVIFEKDKPYNIDVFWVDEVVPWSLEYPLYYMAPTSVSKDVSFKFSESLDGGIIQGVCYNPI